MILVSELEAHEKVYVSTLGAEPGFLKPGMVRANVELSSTISPAVFADQKDIDCVIGADKGYIDKRTLQSDESDL